MSETLIEQFHRMISGETSEAVWRQFAASLPPHAFDELRSFLIEPRSVHEMALTRTAFLVFAQEQTDFRQSMAKYALSTLDPENPAVQTRVALRCLVDSGQPAFDDPLNVGILPDAFQSWLPPLPRWSLHQPDSTRSDLPVRCEGVLQSLHI